MSFIFDFPRTSRDKLSLSSNRNLSEIDFRPTRFWMCWSEIISDLAPNNFDLAGLKLVQQCTRKNPSLVQTKHNSLTHQLINAVINIYVNSVFAWKFDKKTLLAHTAISNCEKREISQIIAIQCSQIKVVVKFIGTGRWFCGGVQNRWNGVDRSLSETLVRCLNITTRTRIPEAKSKSRIIAWTAAINSVAGRDCVCRLSVDAGIRAFVGVTAVPQAGSRVIRISRVYVTPSFKNLGK
jgi:hypothetical protein